MKDRACGIIVRKNKMMFIEQWYTKDDLRHMFVGGGVEENETPEQAVLRELAEEANVSGEILFGPLTLPERRRLEHIFVVHIDDDATPSPGYDPELSADDQVITDIIFLDVDEDICRFTEKDMEYFSAMIAKAEKEHVCSDWLMTLKRLVANYRVAIAGR